MEEVRSGDQLEHTRTLREEDEDVNRPGRQSKHWASEDRRDELLVIR